MCENLNYVLYKPLGTRNPKHFKHSRFNLKRLSNSLIVLFITSTMVYYKSTDNAITPNATQISRTTRLHTKSMYRRDKTGVTPICNCAVCLS